MPAGPVLLLGSRELTQLIVSGAEVELSSEALITIESPACNVPHPTRKLKVVDEQPANEGTAMVK